jgi:hypothetical protein
MNAYMATKKHIQRELEELHGSLKSSARAERPASEPPPREDSANPADETELQRVLHALQADLTDILQNAEEAIADHPAASVGSAFVLGFALGRLSARGKS